MNFLFLSLLCVLGLLGACPPAMASPPLDGCAGIKDLVFVAHQDDDLLFMNPDIQSAIEAGGCVQTVYLTASDRGEGALYMLARERGVRAAYAYMARVPDVWTENSMTVAGHRIVSFTLNQNPGIQLVHLRLQDPWLGKGWGSLTPLSQAESIPSASALTIGMPSQEAQVYNRASLLATIRQLVADYGPTSIRHLDASTTFPYTSLCWRCAGHGHPDHIASARLVRDALSSGSRRYDAVGYIDYPSQERPANLSPSDAAQKAETFKRYAWHDYKYCNGPAHCQEPAGPAAAWVARIYYVSRHNAPPTLLSRAEGGYQLVAVGESNGIISLWDSTSGRWAALGGRSASSLVVSQEASHAAFIYSRDVLGQTWVAEPEKLLQGANWQRLGDTSLMTVPASAPRGAPVVIGMGSDGRLRWTEQLNGTHTEGWAPWGALPALPENVLPNRSEDVSIIRTKDEARAYLLDQSGLVWQSTASMGVSDGAFRSSGWTAWSRLPLPHSKSLTAVQGIRGSVHFFAIDLHKDRLHHHRQSGTGEAQYWEHVTSLPFQASGRPAVLIDEFDKATVAAIDVFGTLWVSEDGTLKRLGEDLTSTPSMARSAQTVFLAARRRTEQQVYVVWEQKAGQWNAVVVLPPPAEARGAAFAAPRLMTHSPKAQKIAVAPAIATGQPSLIPH